MSTSPPPGWYLSENDADIERWWDGATWTGHTRRAEPLTVTNTQIAPVLTLSPNVAAGQRANVWAVAAFWCGAGSLLFNPWYLTSLAAIILGILGITRASQSGVGRGPSIVGLVLGIVGMTLGGWLFWTFWAWR
jgi:hypothetical protein